ncbi:MULTISPECIES: hypothetical protein [Kamptonema]|uniref:hypothetical protein n=1 Tax=Kamptonema TaxID=1501433 RepID=UPI0002FAFD91|nr:MULTISPECIES: hypothetical protein [Kamptonema]
MLNRIGEQQPETLKLLSPVPLALHPVAVYLNSLGSDRSKATFDFELVTIALGRSLHLTISEKLH